MESGAPTVSILSRTSARKRKRQCRQTVKITLPCFPFEKEGRNETVRFDNLENNDSANIELAVK